MKDFLNKTQNTQAKKEKMVKIDYIKIQNKIKKTIHCLEDTCNAHKDQYPKYIKNSYNSIRKRKKITKRNMEKKYNI